MKCNWVCLLAALVLAVSLPSHSFGAIPQSINYQGRLTSATGAAVTDTVDLVFAIYSDSTGGSQLWAETQTNVIVKDGLFAVLLGTITPIPANVFGGSVRYLSTSMNGTPVAHRLPMVSVAYAYKSVESDTANYVRNGGTSDCSDCNSTFVNVAGPDSVYATKGAAFLGTTEGATASELRGVEGYASNGSNGHAYGGSFSTSSQGTGIHYGLKADGNGAATANTYGVLGTASNTSSGNTYGGRFTVNTIGTGAHYALSSNASSSSSSASYGIDATAYNTSSGDAYGGRFSALTNGTGVHYALSADAAGSSSSATYGLTATASNSSTGTVYGAALTAEAGGTGTHYGAYVNADGTASATTYGVWSEANNTSDVGTGNAYGGYFRGTSSGTGRLWGVAGNAAGSSTSDCYAVYGYGTNTSSGDIYSGYFVTGSSGTGVHYGVKAEASGSSTGEVYGGYFSTGSAGTGAHFGLRSEGTGSSTSAVHGIISGAVNTSTGPAYGGTFTANSTGDGTHYGIYSQSSSSSSRTAFGVYGTADNSSTGRAYGGYFAANGQDGTGTHTAVYGAATDDSPQSCIGVYGFAENTSAVELGAVAYAGYFIASEAGAGWKVGVQAEAPSGDGEAGMFFGDVWVNNDFYVHGSKSAVVKMDDSRYRKVYCQESTENWFEDFGEGQLINGSVHIELDPLFLQTVTIDANSPIKVFIQLNDEHCNGTAVRRGTTGFDVIELQQGVSNAAFSYRVVAKRRGYESNRMDLFNGPTPEERETMSAKVRSEMQEQRAAAKAEEQRLRTEQAAATKKSPVIEEQ